MLDHMHNLLDFFVPDSRAGGGDLYSGGGDGSGGGGGDGGGGGGEIDPRVIYELLVLLVRLHRWNLPVALVVDVVLIVGVVFYWKNKQAKRRGSQQSASGSSGSSRQRSQSRRPAAPADPAMVAAYEQLKQRDGKFDRRQFLGRVQNAFIQTQNAWSSGKLEKLRPMVTDGVYERFGCHLKLNGLRRIHNSVEQLQVRSVTLVGCGTDANFDTLHVRIEAAAHDVYRDAQTRQELRASAPGEVFVEVWSFLRRPGARTLERPGLLEGQCPACSAPITASASVVCESCKAQVNSGEHDWVLAEITQTVAHAPTSTNVPGLAAMVGADPRFNRQDLEDRVSATFWRLREAEMKGDTRRLAVVATPEFLKAGAMQWKRDGDGSVRFFADAAVASVDLVRVDPNIQDGIDRAFVRVKWSGHPMKAQLPSLVPPAPSRSAQYEQDFVLIRQVAARAPKGESLKESGFTVHRCPCCGAAESGDDDGKCGHCGQLQNDGSRSWVLERIENAGAQQVARAS